MSVNEKKFLRPVSNLQLRTSTRPKTVEVQKKNSKEDDKDVIALKEKQALLNEIETLKEANETRSVQVEELKAALSASEEETETLKHLNETLTNENQAINEANKDLNVQSEETKLALITLTKENESLKRSNARLLHENEIFEDENTQFSFELDRIKDSFTALKEHDKLLGSLNLELQNELRKIRNEKESYLPAVEAHISEDGAVHCTTEGLDSGSREMVSLNGDRLFDWEKIEKDNFKEKNLNLKKDKKMAAEFVSYIKQNVFESDMTNFVKAAATVVFKKEFFIESLSFKHEEGRVCVKDSKVLECFEASVESKFEVKKVGDFIQLTFKNFKTKLRRNLELWDEY